MWFRRRDESEWHLDTHTSGPMGISIVGRCGAKCYRVDARPHGKPPVADRCKTCERIRAKEAA